jgi:DNA polymerase-4
VGAEDTFEEDLTGVDALRPHVHSQALRVGRRLRRAGVKGRVVQLKLKFADFTLITRRTTLREATDDGQTLYRTALELLERSHEGKPIRLTGVSVQLDEVPPQLGLFPAAPPRTAKLNAALDRIAERFGSKAITTADIAGSEAPDDDEHRSERPVDKPKR